MISFIYCLLSILTNTNLCYGVLGRENSAGGELVGSVALGMSEFT